MSPVTASQLASSGRVDSPTSPCTVFFFFQAEDGIRDYKVTGVQTCALPICTDQLRVETFALEQPAFTHGLADYLMAQEPAVVAAEFLRVELSETEAGLRSENGVLVEILPPGTRRLYWKGLGGVGVQVGDLQAGAELPAALAARLTQTQLRDRKS